MREYSEKERAWIWLSDALGTNVAVIEALLYLNGGLIPAFEEARCGLLKFPQRLHDDKKRALLDRCSDAHIDWVINGLDRMGIHAVTRDSANYPELLREIYDPPSVLYVKGRLPEKLMLPIAVIGSRKCSDYGRGVAFEFGKVLAQCGACIISGMAVGCDSEAAKGALAAEDAEFPTIAVMAGGVDVVYPSGAKKLYDAIAERGAVISEAKPGRSPVRESFPQRNRIISGISKGVLVVEAGERSGTSITVGFAHEQGRDVFAVPGRINDPMSRGSNDLIKNGEAKAVFDVDDILCEYGTFTSRADSAARRDAPPDIPEDQLKVYSALLLGEKTVDKLLMITGFNVSEINILLTEMELSGIIKQLPNGEYALRR